MTKLRKLIIAHFCILIMSLLILTILDLTPLVVINIPILGILFVLGTSESQKKGSRYLRDNNPEIYKSRSSGVIYFFDTKLTFVSYLKLTEDDLMQIEDGEIKNMILELRTYNVILIISVVFVMILFILTGL